MEGNEVKFKRLQELIDEAAREGKPYDDYVKEQISLLEDSHDKFLELAKSEGYSLDNPRVGDIEVAQYAAMRQLAASIGLPTEYYSEKIKEVRIRVFGLANYKNYFEKQAGTPE